MQITGHVAGDPFLGKQPVLCSLAGAIPGRISLSISAAFVVVELGKHDLNRKYIAQGGGPLFLIMETGRQRPR